MHTWNSLTDFMHLFITYLYSYWGTDCTGWLHYYILEG